MSVTSSVATQQKFSNVRKRLDQLGYRQPLGLESLPLVERLFSDLIHTTECLKNAKMKVNVAVESKADFDSQIEPYKADNAKLVQENNELHQRMLKQKDELEALVSEMKASVRKLEHENTDLKFLNNQYVHKVKQLEKESRKKSDRIVELQEKNFQAVVQTPGGRKKAIPFRRQRMEIDSTVPSRGQPAREPGLRQSVLKQLEEPYVADMLLVADSKIAELTRLQQNLKDEAEIAERKINSFRKQVESRDVEIDRLNRMLEGGRPYDVVSLESKNRSNERLISHLNIQVDYLQQRNRELETQLNELRDRELQGNSRRLDLDAKNKALENELEGVDRLAKRLQDEKEAALVTADHEVNQSRADLDKSHRELDDIEAQLEQCRAEKVRLETEIHEVRSNLAASEADHAKTEALLEKVQEDKRKLALRVNRLTSNERELVMEIERLKTRKGLNNRASKSPTRIDGLIKSLEDERDYWKGECDVLQKMMRLDARPSRVPSPKRTPSRTTSSTRTPPKRAPSPSPIRSRTAASPVRSRASTPSGSAKKEKNGPSSAHYDAIIRVLEDERDYYKREFEMARALGRYGSPSRVSPPTKDRLSDDSELQRLQRERDELQCLLDKFERHMAEIQANVKVLTTERDNLSNLYEETKSELHRLRQDVVKSSKSPKVSLAAQAVLRRVESEREDALTDLHRTSTERDSLRERLKLATECQLSDRARLEQRIEDAENSMRISQADRDDLASRVGSLKDMVCSLEDQCKSQQAQLNLARDEAAQHKATANQMRVLADQSERSVDDSQRRLARKETELRSAEDKVKLLEERLGDMSRINIDTREELSRLRGTVNALDREKDALQAMVDEKTERIALMEDDITCKGRQLLELRSNQSELETKLANSNDDNDSAQRQISSLQRQVDSVQQELDEMSKSRDGLSRENRRLQEDLALMTKENQSLSTDMDDVINDREKFKTQVQDYVAEVKRVEDVLSEKEQERTDLLEQYRQLSLEADKIQTQSHQLESEGSNLRLELMTKDSEIRRLKDRLEQADKEAYDSRRHARDLELQVSNLNKNVAGLEDSNQEAEEERYSLLRDLAAVRDLCSKLEMDKESLQRQMTARSLDIEQYQAMVDDANSELMALKSQMSSERTAVKDLEDVLQAEREKDFKLQLNTQEKESEIGLLRDRLIANESRIESQGRELSILRTKNMELEAENEHLRRQLTSERFEKERVVQELRRTTGLSPPSIEQRTQRLNASSRSNLSTHSRHSTSPSRRSVRTPDYSLRSYTNDLSDI